MLDQQRRTERPSSDGKSAQANEAARATATGTPKAGKASGARPGALLPRAGGPLPRYGKQFILIGFDILALLFVVWVAYSLRFDRLFRPSAEQALVMAAVPVIAIPIFIRLGLYRAVIRYLPERAIWTIFSAVTVATLLWVMLAFLTEMTGAAGVPRSIPLIFWALAMLVIVGSRFGAKWLIWSRRATKPTAVPTIIYGTDQAAMQLVNALKTTNERKVVAFVSDDHSLHGMELLGIRVHPAAALEKLIRLHAVEEVILTSPTNSNARRRELIAQLSAHKAKFRILPAISDLAAGKYLVSYLRDIDIDDLLGRSQVPADTALMQSIVKDNVILVSGAAGSIGSELCRTVAQLRPSKLVLFDFDEHGLYEIDRELKRDVELELVPVLGTALDGALVEAVLKKHQVRTIYHCAAYKHVPMVEENVVEGIRNNVLGTKMMAEAALRCGVENFILISSDKAVRPTSVMGATKRWAELIVRHCGMVASRSGADTRYASVRFGNVLGSSGSVVPLFKEQIAAGGPVTITDENMKRYFMSVREATELIIQATGLCESGDILLLEMGEPVSIKDLAEDMILLAGLSVRKRENPEGDIEIAVIGTRNGEKLFEELFYDPEHVTPTAHPKILRAKRRTQLANAIPEALAELDRMLAERDEAALRRHIFEFIRQ